MGSYNSAGDVPPVVETLGGGNGMNSNLRV